MKKRTLLITIVRLVSTSLNRLNIIRISVPKKNDTTFMKMMKMIQDTRRISNASWISYFLYWKTNQKQHLILGAAEALCFLHYLQKKV